MQFDWFWFFIGIIVVIIGALIIRFYNQIADATHMMNYSRWKMTGVIVIIVGFLISINLHTWIITAIINMILGI